MRVLPIILVGSAILSTSVAQLYGTNTTAIISGSQLRGGVEKNGLGGGKVEDHDSESEVALWGGSGAVAEELRRKDVDEWEGDKWGEDWGSGGGNRVDTPKTHLVPNGAASAILPSRRLRSARSPSRQERKGRRLKGQQWRWNAPTYTNTNPNTYYSTTNYYPYPPQVVRSYNNAPPAYYPPPPPPPPAPVDSCCATSERYCPMKYPAQEQVLMSGLRICCLYFGGGGYKFGGYGSSSYTDLAQCPIPTDAPTSSPSSTPSLAPTRTNFLICRQVPGREGYGLPEYNPDYQTLGTPVYSAMTYEDASGEEVSEAIDLSKDVVDSVVGVLSTLEKLKGLNVALSAASGILSMVSFFFSKGEVDPTEQLIKDGFKQLNDAIRKLSDQVSEGFDLIRKDLANAELDDLMSSLQAINFAYQEMQAVTLEENVSPQIKQMYTDRYRHACNRPHFTPEDIFRNLYGYACGDNEGRSCEAGEASDTGLCKFGVKKRQYILDIIFDTAGGLPSNVRGFGTWLAETLILAQFHYSACLPADASTCNDPFTDPIRKKISNDQVEAFQEVLNNIEREENCIQNVNFKKYLAGDTFYRNVAANKECFEKHDDGPNINGCMAETTRERLEKEFPTKHWAVVVYSKSDSDTDLSTTNIVKLCAPDEKGGCVSTNEVPFEKENGRFFHLLYRIKDAGPKEYEMSPVEVGSKEYSSALSLLRDEGIRRDCWDDPILPTDDRGTSLIEVLTESHGYIATREGVGIERAWSRNQDFDVFNFLSLALISPRLILPTPIDICDADDPIGDGTGVVGDAQYIEILF